MVFVEKPTDVVFRFYLVNASEYDNGNKETSGIWLEFPADIKRIENALEDIGLPPDAEQGQYFIDECQCILKSLNPLVNVRTDIHELAKTAERLDTFDGFQMMKLDAVMQTAAKFNNLKYFIYQLKSGDDTRDFRFESLERLHSKGEFADKNNYDLIYSAAYMPSDTLEKLFQRFNIDIPQDFKGHSLSVSDIVVISGKGEEKAYYCDSVGFKEVPEFLDYIRIRSAVISNYEGYTALVGTDDKVYLGANENYHYMFDAPSYYDNSDKSVIHISDNHKMYSFLPDLP